MRPRLPGADALLPYLKRIDEARTYTNFGPLVAEFENRLAFAVGMSPAQVVSASSGTAALIAAILAIAGRASAQRRYALMPAYTFIATAAAAESCGYLPLLADVDDTTWSLSAAACQQLPVLPEVGVVIPVAPYGRPVAQEDWASFRARTGVPVVIDAAACFEAATADPMRVIGPVPLALSFHATKSFACGEGGAVLCESEAIVARALKALNFGFSYDRNSRVPSTNGKMSEYHAAVGLAEFDGWASKHSDFANVAANYRSAFAEHGIGRMLHCSPELSSCYALVECASSAQASELREALSAQAIDHRFWYGAGLHAHPRLRTCARISTKITDQLAPRLLGLPLAVDLAPAAIGRIADCVASASDH